MVLHTENCIRDRYSRGWESNESSSAPRFIILILNITYSRMIRFVMSSLSCGGRRKRRNNRSNGRRTGESLDKPVVYTACDGVEGSMGGVD